MKTIRSIIFVFYYYRDIHQGKQPQLRLCLSLKNYFYSRFYFIARQGKKGKMGSAGIERINIEHRTS
jgi:hypothetical protein